MVWRTCLFSHILANLFSNLVNNNAICNDPNRENNVIKWELQICYNGVNGIGRQGIEEIAHQAVNKAYI
jgi:hypothetical protein